MVTPALKAASKDLEPVTTPVAGGTEKVAKDPCISRTSTPVERQQLAAAEAYAEKSQMEGSKEAAVQALERPYTTSYFLPGKLEGRPVQFLVDTGCTTNLLSKHVFDRLPERVRNELEESDSHGVMADGTQLPFYGVIRLSFRVRDVKTEEVFVVSRINEDAILGMPFLVTHNCSMEFHQPVIQVDGRELKCTDRHGRLLIGSVQVTHELIVPPRTEMAVPCRVTTKNFCPLGVIEGQTDGLPVATSLNPPGATQAEEPTVEPAVEPEQAVLPPEPTLSQPTTTGRPSRVIKKLMRYKDYECYPCMDEPGDKEPVETILSCLVEEATPDSLEAIGPGCS